MPPRKAAAAAKTPANGGVSGFAASPEALEVAAKAASTMWWWDRGSGGWRTRDAFVAPSSGTKTAVKDETWTPWETLVDTGEAPYFRWFAGGWTNACFNAVDRHVLDGRGDEVAMTSLPEEITVSTPRCDVTRRELLGAVATVAAVLRETHDVQQFDRVLFHAPTDLTLCVYMLACQRLGAVYSATAVDAAIDVLGDRIEDLSPKLVICAPNGSTQHAGVSIDCAAKSGAAIGANAASGAPRPEKPALVQIEPTWGAFHKKYGLERWGAMSDAEAFVEANPEQEADASSKPRKKQKKGVKLATCSARPVEADHPLFVSYTSGSTGSPKGVVHGHGGYVSGVCESMTCVFLTKPGEGCGVTTKGGGILTVGSAGWITGQSYQLMGPLLAAVRSVLIVGSPVFPSPLRAFETIEREKITILKTGSAVVRQLMTDPSNAGKLDGIDTSSLRVATFCAEPVSIEVHQYAAAHVTKNFINSYWATEHGSMVFSRNVSVPIATNAPDTKTWPLPWVSVSILPETSDVIITGPYPSLALTVFGDVRRLDLASLDARNSGSRDYGNLQSSRDGNVSRGRDGGRFVSSSKPWRGDLARYESSYWLVGANGFVQGDVARAHTSAGSGSNDARSGSGSRKPPPAKSKTATATATATANKTAYTFHGRSDEVINVNGNRVGTEQIEACLWNVETNGWHVEDVCVVGAPDFVKGDSPVAFVKFQKKGGNNGTGRKIGSKQTSKESQTLTNSTNSSHSIDSIDLVSFKADCAKAIAKHVGAYASLDHVFVVADLPKTVTNKTSRKTLQVLLRGDTASDTSLARRHVLVPIAKAVTEWRKLNLVSSHSLDLRKYWAKYTVDEHSVQGRPIVPGAGWLCLLSCETQSLKLQDVAFMRGVFSPSQTVVLTKRRKALQATVGTEVVLRASVGGGAAAPETIGPRLGWGPSIDGTGDGTRHANNSKNNRNSGGTKRKPTDQPPPGDVPSPKRAKKQPHPEPIPADRVLVTEEATRDQHYRRCAALRLEYAGSYRAVQNVEWSGHVFKAQCTGTHLAAVLDAGLQVVCASIRGATFIPVAVKEFHLTRLPDEFAFAFSGLGSGSGSGSGSNESTIYVHGEIIEQHPEYLIADLRYEMDGTFAAMGRVRFARVEGVKPREQPENRRSERDALGARAQTLDPKTSLARLRQLTGEQRVEAVRSVIRFTVSDLTDTDVDFDKTVFDNGMHSLNAVELLSRVNDALGTGVTTKLVVADAPMSAFAETVAEHAMTYESPDVDDPSSKPFPNVDYDTLNELVRLRLAGKTVGVTPYVFLAKYFAYNWFKKAFQFFRIGGPAFVLNPPKSIDLGVEVSMNRRVEFRDIDMNQHYTVEMIVARSVDGVEQLMAKTGLSHVELYYKRNLFAAKIQSTFHKELALGDKYFIKTKITKVAGALMDIRVAFLDKNNVLCFEILWTILIVLDSRKRVLLDWENVDLMEGKRLLAGPGKDRIEAPATPKKRKILETEDGDEE